MTRKKQVNTENGAVLNRDFPRRSRFVFLNGTRMRYRIKYPYRCSSKPMVHAWDIIKNVPLPSSVEVWDKVGIYQIVSLAWRGGTDAKQYVTSGVPRVVLFGI